MKIFVIGDLHLSNAANVDKPMDIYGGEWKDHDKKLEVNWKSLLTSEDIMMIAGDLSWALKWEELEPDLEWVHSMPGKKVLIKGNHDLWWASTNKLNKLYEDMYFLQNTCYEAGDYIICGTRGWSCPGSSAFAEHDMKLYTRELARLKMSLDEGMKKAQGREIIAMLHYPPTNEKKEPSGFTEMFETYGVKKVYYGHLHGYASYDAGIKGNRNGVEYNLISCDYLKCMPMFVGETEE